MMNDQHEELLKAWEVSWNSKGWKTRVLTIDDAKKHPEFDSVTKELERLGLSPYNRKCYWRWMAMAALDEYGNEGNGAYFMSDYDTIPLELDSDEGLKLIDESKGIFTTYQNHVPCLMQASRSEWDRVLHLLIDSLPEGVDATASDMISLLKVRETLGDETGIIWKDEVQTGFPFQKDSNGEVVIDCLKSKKLAVHLSHNACKEAYWGGFYPDVNMKYGMVGARSEVAALIGQEYSNSCHKQESESIKVVM